MKENKSLLDDITTIPQINEKYAVKLNKLGIYNIKDLLTYFPRKYNDSSEITQIKDLSILRSEGEEYLIKCRVKNFKSIYLRSRKTLQTAKALDESGEVNLTWFNQPFLKNTFTNEENEFLLSGKLKFKGKRAQLLVNNYEQIKEEKESTHLGRIVPEYPLTEGITKKWFRNRIKYLVDEIDKERIKLFLEFQDTIKNINLAKDIKNVHFPESVGKLEDSINKLSLIELVDVHLKILKNKSLKKINPSVILKVKEFKKEIDKFITNLPFKLTKDQEDVLNSILNKLKQNLLINELIQGDVGSGKTIIAIILSYLAFLNGLQTVVLVPTTVLAKQHFSTFQKFLKFIKEEIVVITSDVKETYSKKIIIGTSAVLARKQELIKNVGLIIVDEQHRFGVTQREELLSPFTQFKEEKNAPHFINMTATPIPRTIAETFFGDVEVSLIKNKPKDRLEIKTFLINDEKRNDCINWIKEKISNESEQVYWICPLIEDSEEVNAKSAKKTYDFLKKKLPEIKIGLLHGKLKAKEKVEIMEDYAKNKINLLVSTTVIEVGIDVPNASIMVIENPERFGLASLHQIRGRIGRGKKQSWCFLLPQDEISQDAAERLDYFCKTTDGLEIAKYDLERRGPGEVYGNKQSGIPNLKIAKLNNLVLIKKSKSIAENLFSRGVEKISLFR